MARPSTREHVGYDTVLGSRLPSAPLACMLNLRAGAALPSYCGGQLYTLDAIRAAA
jgi:hypothetical protein